MSGWVEKKLDLLQDKFEDGWCIESFPNVMSSKAAWVSWYFPYHQFLKAGSDKISIREILTILILSQVRSYEKMISQDLF